MTNPPAQPAPGSAPRSTPGITPANAPGSTPANAAANAASGITASGNASGGSSAAGQRVPRWNLLPALCAWLLPGLGHYLLGERRRGAILACTIATLWLGGLLIGGVSVIDRHHPTEPGRYSLWYFGQVLVAPSLAVDWYRSALVARTMHTTARGHPAPPADPSDPPPPFEPSYGRVSEQGILFTALAGMLNLLAVIDVLYRDPARPRQDHPTLPHPRPTRS